jgi:DNA-binding NarL/FixJ family response regulator
VLEPAGGAGDGSSRELARGGALRAVLSAREREVLDLLVAGATNQQIAQRLVIVEGTAKAHVHKILRKLGASNRAEAVAIWLRAC